DFQRQRGQWVVIAVTVAVSLLLFTWVISLQISAGLIARGRLDENKRAEQERLAAFVANVREALTNADSLEHMLQRCAEAILQHLNPDLARIWVLDRED